MPPPPIRVRLAPALLPLFPGAPARLEMAADSVGAVIDGLDRRWPGMGDRLRDSRPALRRHIKVFVNGEPAGLGTALHGGEEVDVLTAVSGG